MIKTTGGSAFPLAVGSHESWQDGMTLRDWFAGQALNHTYVNDLGSPDEVADWAYQLADAMLAEREKQQ